MNKEERIKELTNQIILWQRTIEAGAMGIERAEEELAQLKADPAQPFAEAQYCWFIESDGTLRNTVWCSDNQFITSAYHQGNVFSSEAEAIAERDARAVIQELRDSKGQRKFILNQDNYSFIYEPISGGLEYTVYAKSCVVFAHLYWYTKKLREAAIAKVGIDRVLKAVRFRETGEI